MKKRLISIISLAVIVAISIAMFATGVFASEATSTTKGNGSEPKLEQRRNRLSGTEHLKNMLDTLVADGAITQTEADEAYALATAEDTAKADFSKLPQAVKDALQAKMPQKGENAQNAKFNSAQILKNALSCLVADGAITQTEADEAYALATADDATKADFSKLPQAVKDALQAKMPQKGENAQNAKFNSAQMLKNALSCLVSDGTITQTEADEAYALATADNAAKADFSKLPQAVKDALQAKMPQKGEGQRFNGKINKTTKN